jgi:hypothetical protein
MDKIDGEFDGGTQTPDIGPPRAGERQSGTVVHGRPNHGQTEGHVDGVTEAGVFEHR